MDHEHKTLNLVNMLSLFQLHMLLVRDMNLIMLFALNCKLNCTVNNCKNKER